MRCLQRIAEQRIEEAMAEGRFDNLAGKGEPLRLDENPFADPAWRVAFHALQSGGFTLPWIAMRREIVATHQQLKEMLLRACLWRKAKSEAGSDIALVNAEWQRVLALFSQKIDDVNENIFVYNLSVPSDQFRMEPLNSVREVREVMRLAGCETEISDR